MKTLNATTCPDSCCGNYPESMTFDNCKADATDPIAPKALRTFHDDLDNIALIDEACRFARSYCRGCDTPSQHADDGRALLYNRRRRRPGHA